MTVRKTLYFKAAAVWVQDQIQEDLKQTPIGAVHLVNDRSDALSGSLTLVADSNEKIEVAWQYIIQHPVYKHHFRE